MWILGLTPTTRTTVIVVRNKQVSAREEHIQLKKNIFSSERIFSAEEEYFQPLNIVAPVAHPVLYLHIPCTQPPTFSVFCQASMVTLLPIFGIPFLYFQIDEDPEQVDPIYSKPDTSGCCEKNGIPFTLLMQPC